MISLHEVTKSFEVEDGQQMIAVDGMDLEVPEGQFLSLIGPSGCGKSTVLDMVAGLTQPNSGLIEIDDSAVTGPRQDVGVMFQEDATFPWMTNQKNVEFGLQNTDMSSAEKRERATEVLRLVGLEGFEGRYPQQLSGGMRQRVNLARVLAARPRVVLLDEPFGALDEQTRLALGDELMRILAETGATFVLVTHSLGEAALLADQIVVMTPRPGRVRELVTNPQARPRSSEMLRTPAFSSTVGHLWDLLSNEAEAPPAGEARDRLPGAASS